MDKETKYLLAKIIIYFLYNYPDYKQFCHKIFLRQTHCNEQHILSKIEDAFAHTNSGVEAWTRFYLECDDELRKAFVDSVINDYAGKGDLFN